MLPCVDFRALDKQIANRFCIYWLWSLEVYESIGSFPRIEELRWLRRLGPIAMEPWACSRCWMLLWWQLVCLFLLNECKMCRNAFGSYFCNCLQADWMVIHGILFCVWRCPGFFGTFSTFFFICYLFSGICQACICLTSEATGRDCFLNEACKDGKWVGCAEKHVPECISPTQTGWKEKLSTPQAAHTALTLSFPPPYFKFHNWENRASSS